MEEQNNIRTIGSSIKPYKSYTEPKFISNRKLYNSSSMKNLNTLKSAKVNSEGIKKKRGFPRSSSQKMFFDHYDKKNCEYCEGIDNLLQSDKTNLSSFIQDNSQFLNLFGNKRYNKSSPYLFVEDYKCGIDDDKIGLVPLPSKPRIVMTSPKESIDLHEIQRKIVMIRRFQYGKRNFSEPNYFKYSQYYDHDDDLDDIILIQKVFRGYIVRKKVEYILNFKDIIDRWQQIFDKLKAKIYLRILINYEPNILTKVDNIKGYNYITKIRRNKSPDVEIYQKNYIYKNKNHKNEEKKYSEDSSDNLLKNIDDLKKYSKKIIPKEHVRNNSSLLTKEYYHAKDSKEKINKIENNFKNYLDSKKNIIKKEDEKEKNMPKGLYIDKIYYSQLLQKLYNFNNIIRNAMLKATFRKKPNLKKVELKEVVNNRLDIKPDNNKKNNDVVSNLKNPQNGETLISSKEFNFKNTGFYADKKRKKIGKIDNETKEPLIFSISKNITLNYENENVDKDQKISDKDDSSKKLILPKDKYCYVTKEYKDSKENKIIDEDNKKPTKELTIASNERFNYEGKLSNEITNKVVEITEKNNNLSINNKQEIRYDGKEKDNNGNKFNKDFNNNELIIDNNTKFNFLKNGIQENIPVKPINLLKDNNFSINYLGSTQKIIDNKKYDLSFEKINEFKYEGKEIPTEKKSFEKNYENNIVTLPNINYIGKNLDSKKSDELNIQKNTEIEEQKNNINNNTELIIKINNKLKMEKKENFSYEGDNKDNKRIDENNLDKENIDNINKNNEQVQENNINLKTLEKISNEAQRQFNQKDIILESNNSITFEGIKDLKDSQFLFKRTDISINGKINNGLLITKSRYNKNITEEKIYKKPLFNEFFSYFVEQPLTEEESQKLKAKPKKVILTKKESKEKIIPKEKNKDSNSERSSSSNKPSFDKNLLEKDEQSSGLIKRIIPEKDSTKTFKIKPNHLLKVIKVAKGKPTYEQYIHVGKIIPKKVKEEDEEFLYIRYKSKTPSKSQKKYILNNLLKKYNGEEKEKKSSSKWKDDKINLKTKQKIEENDSEEDSEDKNKIIKKSNLIKVYKYNSKNYCYASKIRKKYEEKDNKSINNIEKEIEENDDKYIPKEEFRQNIIKNNCYCDKDTILKSTYNNFLNYYRNLNKEEIIIQNPITYKNNDKIPNYISKIRRVKDQIKEELNEKPVNKLSLITKKRMTKLILPILERANLNLKKCVITKVNQRNCAALPNPVYKNEFYIITKKRKKIIQKDEELKLPSEKSNYCLITKERKKLIKENSKIPLKKIHYIEKQRKNEIIKDIKTIQNIFRSKKNQEKKNENILFNNKDKNAIIPKIRFYHEKGEDILNDKNNYIFEGYISKVIKSNIFKLYPHEQCYISKEAKFTIKNQKQPNCSFLSLLDFFIKKNIQEYIFPKLFLDKENLERKKLDTNSNVDSNRNIIEEEEDNDDYYTYPKYYKNLRRIFNFYKTEKREESPKAQKIYDEIIPDIKNSKSLNDLVIKLNDNPENSNKLIDNQNKEGSNKIINNNNLIDEIEEFVKFDKNLSNSSFIKNKMKENPAFKNNKNVFNIIENVDKEYNKLMSGKYCFKCGKEVVKCKCDDINYIFKETDRAEEIEKEGEGEEDEDLDFDMDNDDGINTKKINYFEYDSKKKQGLQMINKPKLDDYVSQPKKVLQIYNQKQLNEINKNIQTTKGNLKTDSLNLFNSSYGFNKPLNTESNYNQRYASFTNNNINNILSSNNDYNALNSK